MAAASKLARVSVGRVFGGNGLFRWQFGDHWQSLTVAEIAYTDRMETLFEQLLEIQRNKRLPPVTQWQPTAQGEIDIQICADGTWLHEDQPIRRANMVALFATILRLDEQGYALVTPVERLAIRVDDKPFLAVDVHFKYGNQGTANATGEAGAAQLAATELLFTTNVGDHVRADKLHPLTATEPMPPVSANAQNQQQKIDEPAGPPVPCLLVRDGLQARFSRPLYYRLVDYALQVAANTEASAASPTPCTGILNDHLVVSSAGQEFDLGSVV